MRLSDLKRPRLTESQVRMRHHQPDAYELTFRRFIAALQAGNQQQVNEAREELRRLVKDGDRR